MCFKRPWPQETADDFRLKNRLGCFYLPSRGNVIPRVSHLNEPQTFSADSTKIRSKISPRKKRFRNYYCNNFEEESLLMQYCSINIEKLPKRIKKISLKHRIINSVRVFFLFLFKRLYSNKNQKRPNRLLAFQDL